MLTTIKTVIFAIGIISLILSIGTVCVYLMQKFELSSKKNRQQ